MNSKVSTSLPTLENPGGAENLQEGYQLIDDNGNIVNGTLSPPSWNQLNLLPDGGDSVSVGFIGLLPIPEISDSILIICDSYNHQLGSIYVYPDVEFSCSLSVGMDMFNLSVQDFNNTKHLLISTDVDIQDYIFYMLLTNSFAPPAFDFEESN